MNISFRDFWETIPIITIKDGVIVSKRADLTVGWKVTLPATYNCNDDAYLNMNKRLEAAIKALPPWMIVHRQDMFVKSRYGKEKSDSFLGRRFESHFEGRSHLIHQQRIYLTCTSKSSAMRPSGDCGIYGNSSVVTSVMRKDLEKLRQAAGTFEHMVSGKGAIDLERLTDDELTDELETYLHLGDLQSIPTDIQTSPDGIRMLGKSLWCYSLAEARHLPTAISPMHKVDSMSHSNGALYLSYGASIGVMLDCEHIVNAFFMTIPQNEAAAELDKSKKSKTSMSKRNVENTSNAEEIAEYEKEAHVNQLTTVKAYNNLIVWSSEEQEEETAGAAASALSAMGISCTRNTFDTPAVWYSSMPGACAELGKQSFRTAELCSCLCMGVNETFQKDIDGGIIKLCDRLRHIPLKVDFQEAAERHGLITNYNAFILGPSGSGKSFFTNHITRSLYDSGQSIAIIDMGDSYEGLCNIINEESGGKDGIYMKWDEKDPISFDAFNGFEEWLIDGFDRNGGSKKILRLNHDGVLYLMSVIKYLWTPEGGWNSERETLLGEIIEMFAIHCKGRKPILDDLYVYFDTVLKPLQEEGGHINTGSGKVTARMLNISGLATTLKPYCIGGAFERLFNNRNPRDIFTSRFTVFEISQMADSGKDSYYPLVILGMISAFNSIMKKEDKKRKVLIIEEAWKAIANKRMSGFLTELWKTSRKYNTSAIVVSQQFSDLMASESVRDTIIQNSATKILLSQESNMTEIENISTFFGLSPHEKSMVMSIGLGMDSNYSYREVFISLGGKHSSVYGTELSPQEGLAYQTNKKKKEPYLRLARLKGFRNAADELAKTQSNEE